jgi:methionyl-tRNA formyltransferase
MRLIFAGTPVFAERALQALLAAGHDVKLVLTQPDRPAGRGKRLTQSPVKQSALAAGIPVEQPRSLRDDTTWGPVRDAAADAMIVAAYGLILPAGLLSIPTQGCLNIHASVLPRWRGAAPIQRAIEAGDTETGITIMQMDAGLDTGPVRLVRRLPIGPEETGGQLHDRMAELGGEAVVEALAMLEAGTLPLQPQPAEGATYAGKILPGDRALDWSLPAEVLHDRIRAFDPVPGCTGQLRRRPDEAVKIWASRLCPDLDAAHLPPGRVMLADPDRVVVVTGRGVLALTEIQRPGGRRMPVADFQRGAAIVDSDEFI